MYRLYIADYCTGKCYAEEFDNLGALQLALRYKINVAKYMLRMASFPDESELETLPDESRLMESGERNGMVRIYDKKRQLMFSAIWEHEEDSGGEDGVPFGY